MWSQAGMRRADFFLIDTGISVRTSYREVRALAGDPSNHGFDFGPWAF